MKKEIPKKKAIMIWTIGALLSIAAVLFFYSFYALYDFKKIDVYLEVGEKQGIDADTDRVSFGRLMPGSWGSRDIILSQNSGRQLLIAFSIDGNVSRFVRIPEQFTLNTTETRTVGLSAYVPLNETKGVYTGTLKVAFRRF